VYSYLVAQSGQSLAGLSITDPNRFQFVGFMGTNPMLTGDSSGNVFLTFTPVPEPAGMLAAGVTGWVAVRRLRKRPVV